jgi:hypothetical protein
LRDGQPQIAEFDAKRLPGDSQLAGGLVLFPFCELRDAEQEQPNQLPVRFRM